ncbi:MAG: succinate dehydrogenase assembly factor 2 [SAR86 cluster bacterium]|nr:succinate dehydrogenase assembly factor 2 [SAR86 cluster bacterium]
MDSNLHKKAYFLSRRGLQELDIIFKPFVEERFEYLSDKDKLSFLDLLQNNDVDLLDWILNDLPVPEDFNKIVTQIKDYLNNDRR